jgi:site-specific recombinase XerD
LGHDDIATTTIYTRVSADDLARMMGTSEAL